MSTQACPPDGSRSRAWTKAGFFLMIAAIGGMALVVDLRRNGDPPPVEGTTRKRPTGVEKARQGKAPAAAPIQEAVIPTSMAQSAAAMDETVARHDLSRLRMAALSGDSMALESAMRGLRRHGRLAKSLLDQELSAESDRSVRAAFEATKKGIQ